MTKVVKKEIVKQVLDVPEEKLSEYKQAFDMFDKDKTGSISAVEIHKAMKNMGNDMTLKEVKELIANLDEDGSGEIGFEEFVTFVQRTQVNEQITDEEEVIRAFKTFDKDGSGYLSCAEFRYILCSLGDRFSQAEADEVFKEADLDKDGRLNYREFVEFWKNK